jgi:hypothetical protein
LEECTEFIILGLITVVGHAVWSCHHFEKLGYIFSYELYNNNNNMG